uniref:Uncharacterized protein n=1 Tax=Meloidogyne enterolobii TaxID=390850 RepID=A0A6V7Y837_MELEN|nr:unnamed protein product [Meloidogyne enterolobii]
MYLNFPVETKIDIIKCLNFNQITVIQQINRHFFELINKYLKELPRQKFSTMQVTRGEYTGNIIKPEPFNFELSEELNRKVTKTSYYTISSKIFRHIRVIVP